MRPVVQRVHASWDEAIGADEVTVEPTRDCSAISDTAGRRDAGYRGAPDAGMPPFEISELARASLASRPIRSFGRVRRSRAKGDAFVSADSLKPEAVASGYLPPSVWWNVWQHGGGPMTSIQMVNYDLDLTADPPRAVGPFHLSLRVDNRERLASARLIRPGGEAMPLNLKMHCAEIQVTVPAIDLWAIVVLAANGEWETRSVAAKARKRLERLRIASPPCRA